MISMLPTELHPQPLPTSLNSPNQMSRNRNRELVNFTVFFSLSSLSQTPLATLLTESLPSLYILHIELCWQTAHPYEENGNKCW
ncbi:rCG23718 [Rattus norvegicus]|uniref:RCG23718 n=1 Tax=Rattus norvegicus TaxID=10116 RepID=A6JW01_RAT|nr:rCG23718 [Rattus norvegicus]